MNSGSGRVFREKEAEETMEKWKKQDLGTEERRWWGGCRRGMDASGVPSTFSLFLLCPGCLGRRVQAKWGPGSVLPALRRKLVGISKVQIYFHFLPLFSWLHFLSEKATLSPWLPPVGPPPILPPWGIPSMRSDTGIFKRRVWLSGQGLGIP